LARNDLGRGSNLRQPLPQGGGDSYFWDFRGKFECRLTKMANKLNVQISEIVKLWRKKSKILNLSN
jgi:hypothetical protein|tara:strand:- start:8 stop:205 length:198 start_codon:yes stop_codon:yes gene_type:complete